MPTQETLTAAEATPHAESAPGGEVPRLWPALSICFLVTLAVSLWQNLRADHPGSAFVFDAGHYLGACQAVVESAKSLLQPVAGAVPAVDHRLVDYLMLDGPVLPLMASFPFLFIDRIPSPVDRPMFVALQSLLHALEAATVCFLGARLTASRKWGLACGLAWGLYPPAVIAAGHLLSETLCSLLITVIAAGLALVASGRRKALTGAGAALAGAAAALVLLTKPVLGPAIALLFALALGVAAGTWWMRARILSISALAAAVFILPWAVFTFAFTGDVTLTPQRKPVYNLARGLDWEDEGFTCIPDSSLPALFGESEGPVPVAAGMVAAQPAKAAGLLLRKVQRLWWTPWNDYRESFLGMPTALIAWWQRLLLALAVIGTAVLAVKPPGQGDKERSRQFIAGAAVAVLAAQLVYLPFETIPRYGFVSMPFVILLAAVFLSELPRLRVACVACLLVAGVLFALTWSVNLVPFLASSGPGVHEALWCDAAVRTALVLVAALAVSLSLCRASARSSGVAAALWVFLVTGSTGAVLAAQAGGDLVERSWECKLKAGHKAVKKVMSPRLPPNRQPDWALVVFDGDVRSADAVVSVNGHVLPGRPVPLARYWPSRYRLLNATQVFSAAIRKRPEEMRQWRAVAVPPAWLDPGGENTVSIEPGAPGRCTVFGDYGNGRERRTLSFDRVSPGRLWASAQGTEWRLVSALPLPRVRQQSLLVRGGRADSHDLSPAPGRQVGEFRMFLAFGYSKAAASPLALPPSGDRRQIILPPTRVQLSAGGAANPAGKTCVISPGAPPLRGRLVVGNAYELPDFVRVSVRLRARARTASASAICVVSLQSGDRSLAPLVLPATPTTVNGSGEWAEFAVDDSVPPGQVPGGFEYLVVDLTPGSGSLEISDVSFALERSHMPNLDGHLAVVF